MRAGMKSVKPEAGIWLNATPQPRSSTIASIATKPVRSMYVAALLFDSR
tara:strand:+ start:607 stop:753 length:147 start_codon:yes stop_codon:yes gene_type:complete